jgi:hypothetical protein
MASPVNSSIDGSFMIASRYDAAILHGGGGKLVGLLTDTVEGSREVKLQQNRVSVREISERVAGVENE